MLCIGVVDFVLTQESQIYLAPDRSNDDCKGISRMVQDKENGTTIYHHKNQQSGTAVVFYHGNASIVCDILFLTQFFDERGVSYIFPEYAGYSDDSSSPSHENTIRNVEDVVSFIEKQSYEKVYVVGQSIGTGPAVYHAELGEAEKLLLISPFTKLSDITADSIPFYPSALVRLFTKDAFENEKKLEKYKGSLTILHGSRDRIIPVTQGMRLYDTARTNDKTFITLDGYGHNGVYQSALAIEAIQNFLK